LKIPNKVLILIATTVKNNIDMIEVENDGIFFLSEENEKFREEILNFKPHELLVKVNCEK
jgi:hypothetical protein